MFCLHVCLRATCVQYLQRPEEGIISTGAGVIGYEILVSAGKGSQVPCKGAQCCAIPPAQAAVRLGQFRLEVSASELLTERSQLKKNKKIIK